MFNLPKVFELIIGLLGTLMEVVEYVVENYLPAIPVALLYSALIVGIAGGILFALLLSSMTAYYICMKIFRPDEEMPPFFEYVFGYFR